MMNDVSRREWSLPLAALLIGGALWGLHAFCDAFVFGEMISRPRPDTPTSPAHIVCWSCLGPLTWLGVLGLMLLLAAWALPRATATTPAWLVTASGRAGRLIALLLLAAVVLVTVVYAWVGP